MRPDGGKLLSEPMVAYLTEDSEFFLSLVRGAAIAGVSLWRVLMKCQQGGPCGSSCGALPPRSVLQYYLLKQGDMMVITEFQRRGPFRIRRHGGRDCARLVVSLCQQSGQISSCLTPQSCPHRELLPWALASSWAEERWGVGSSPASIFCENGICSVITEIFLMLYKYVCY